MLQFPYPVPHKLVSSLLDQISILSKVLEHMPVSTAVATSVFHQQVLKSSLFSARIEGNDLTLAQWKTSDLTESDRKKKEIDNCMKALRMVKTLPSSLSDTTLKELHAVVMEDIHSSAGEYRAEQSGIFDAAGNVVYLTPDRSTMQQMLDVWFVEANKERSPVEHLVDCARLHFYFEKIHPFFDGNGRTGRVLLQWQLHKTRMFGEFILPIDEYFDTHRSTYYAYLEQNTRHSEEFTAFVLEGIVWALESVLQDVKTVGEQVSVSPSQSISQSLLPRREEMLAIVRDHPLCSLDMIARRFPSIPQRTLAYDLQWLTKQGYVKKHGSTRGVRYSVNNK